MKKLKMFFTIPITVCILFPAILFAQMNWSQATASANWSARYGHTSVLFDNKMWVLGGGYNTYSHKNDVWYTTDGINWVQATDSAAWPARAKHTSVVFNDTMWVIGGEEDGGYRNDVWSSTDGVNWTRATSDAGWPARENHTSVVFDNKMWVMGGFYGGDLNDVWYSTDGINWTQATASAAWSARYGHTSVVFDNKMWVIGGYDNTYSHKNDVWYTTDGVNWVQATPSAGWSGRVRHTSVVFDNKMWVIGGVDSSGFRNDVWYSTDGINWVQTTPSALWTARYHHTSVVFDNKTWVIGGEVNPGSDTNDVWYSPPSVRLNPTSFNVTIPKDQIRDTVLTISNSGYATLNWSLTEIPIVDWVSENPNIGTLVSGRDTNVTVTFNTNGQIPGIYQCTLRVSIDDPVNPIVNIPIQVTVPGWVQKESIPAAYDVKPGKYVKDGGSLVAVGTDLYAFHGNKSKAFYKYADDAWTQLESIPFGVKPTDPLKINKKKIGKGAELCFDNDHTIYATKGNGTREFWEYDISADTWTQDSFVPAPKALKGGTSLAYLGGKVYLLAGGQKKTDLINFYGYDIATNAWTPLGLLTLGPNTKVWKDGACLVVLDGTLYALKSNDKYNPFFSYNIVGNTWTEFDSIPMLDSVAGKRKKIAVKDGGAMCASDDAIYAIKGGGTNLFWKYTTTGGWTRSDTIPRLHKKSVPKTGAALAYADEKVWLLKGNNTPEFWCYTPSTLLLDGIKTSTIASLVTEKNLIAIEPKFEAIPNPAYKFVTINYTLPLATKISLKLYNVSGQLVQTLKDGHTEAGTYTMKISTQNFAAGVYFLKYETNTYQRNLKLIIQ